MQNMQNMQNEENKKHGLRCIVWLILGILCLGGVTCLAAASSSVSEPLEPKEFYERMNRIKVDYEVVLGCKIESLVRRIVEHPIQNHIAVPMHERKRVIVFSAEEDRLIGAAILHQLDELGICYRSAHDEQRVRRIAERIVAVMPKPMEVTIRLVNTKEINALCLIGGNLIVTKRILELFTDDELVFIIAHEYGHAAARHAAESMTKEMLVILLNDKFVNVASNLALLYNQNLALLLEIGYKCLTQLGIILRYDRKMEYEADALAVIYMKKAGYELGGALKAMKHLESLSPQEAFWTVFLSTHPLMKKRLQRLQQCVRHENLKEIFRNDDDDDDQESKSEAMDVVDEMEFVTHDCASPKGRVLFVPSGIFSGSAEDYLPKLAEAFPERTINVVQWNAAYRLTLERPLRRAAILSYYLCMMLQNKSTEELSHLMLVGHSLGGNVVMSLAKMLSQKGIKPESVILMGSTLPYDSTELELCGTMPETSFKNLYRPSDRFLRYAYYLETKVPALGLMGANATVPGLAEYRLPEPTEEETVLEVLQSHQLKVYLASLPDVLNGKIAPDKIRIDHHAIAPLKKLPKRLQTAIPSAGGTVRETYHDWTLVAYTINVPKFSKGIYVIRNPYGELCEWGVREAAITQMFQGIKAKLDAAYAAKP